MHNSTQQNETITFPLIGDKALSFKAITTQVNISFPEDYEGKWVILFSHSDDFTPVCTTQFLTFVSMQEEFKPINIELVGLSVDCCTHNTRINNIKGMKNG